MNKQLLILSLTCLGLSACGGEEAAPNLPGSESLDSGLSSSLEPFEPPFPGASLETPANDPYDNMYAEPAPDEDLGYVAGYGVDGSEHADEYPTEDFEMQEQLNDPGFTDQLPAFEDDLPQLDAGDGQADLSIGELPEMEISDPFHPGGGSKGYRQADAFLVDQDRMNQWQAVNIATHDGQLFIAAVDRKSPTKGTVLRLEPDGTGWNNLSTSWLGTIDLFDWSYTLKSTITGIAIDSKGQLLISDYSARVYTAAGSSRYRFTEKTVNGLHGTLDAVYANGHYFIATPQGIQQLDESFGIPSTLSTLKPTGGLAAHEGLIYAVVQSEVHRIQASGQSQRIISGLEQPIDVAVDNEGHIFVLTPDGVRWFDASGNEQGEFGLGAFIKPKALCLDSSGALYVADEGNDHSDSQIIKFTR